MDYISPWLTHFVGGRTPEDHPANCERLLQILRSGTLGLWEQQGPVLISPGGMGVGPGLATNGEFVNGRPVCFCDIPEQSLQRHTSVYGHFGLAFSKEFLVAQGANPVFYVAKGSIAARERPEPQHLTIAEVEADPHGALAKHFEALNQEPVAVLREEFFLRLKKRRNESPSAAVACWDAGGRA